MLKKMIEKLKAYWDKNMRGPNWTQEFTQGVKDAVAGKEEDEKSN